MRREEKGLSSKIKHSHPLKPVAKGMKYCIQCREVKLEKRKHQNSRLTQKFQLSYCTKMLKCFQKIKKKRE